MKLFAKYSRINVAVTVVIFLIASIAFYFTLHYVFISQIDEDLKIEEREIETYVEEHNRLPESISVKDQLIQYQPASSDRKRAFKTQLMAEAREDDKEKFRQLIFTIKAANQWYQATVSKSLEETENLTRSVLIIAFTTILLILLASFIINRVVLKRIWQPFHRSLDLAQGFKVGGDQKLLLPASTIDEFRLMNGTLEKMTSQARLDYLSLKTFSENASHEIQTPLAVIRSKLDLMIQDEQLTEKQSESLQAAYNSVQKLTRLNQSLLLLAKIENNQFREVRSIDLKTKIEEKIADFHELWTARELSIQKELDDVVVFINEELLEILLNNLLSNVTKHNYSGGRIHIVLKASFLAITNTGRAQALEDKTLYQRFTRFFSGSNSNGLGLSIIKQICDTSGFSIRYEFIEGMHVFNIHWN